MDSLDGVVDLL